MEIISYLKSNIEPLEDEFYGAGYRAAAYLTDGTYLPCVIFRNTNKTVDLAMKRFKEEQTGCSFFENATNGYYEIAKTFIAKGNRVDERDIASVEMSKYAFPLSILRQIKGETGMGWTGFVAKMKDDRYVGFVTYSHTEFFFMPESYSVEDIVEIINHSYVTKTGELHSFSQLEDYGKVVIHRECPFFVCYMDDL